MVLEATLVCVDNSEWMRNGDFVPNRLQAQQDAVHAVCRMKTKLNAENTVGLMSLADNQVRVTLTTDLNKVLKALQQLEPKGHINLISGLRIAHLALKHRQNKNQKIRIIAFVGSPLDADPKELQKLARRLKKEKVNVDIVNFGEDEANTEKLGSFIDALNGKDKTCHLVTCQPGPLLSEAILSSPILSGEDGAPIAPGFEFGIDPSEDPELAMALRVSLEEQRLRQEQETTRVQQESLKHAVTSAGGAGGMVVAQADLPYNPELGQIADDVSGPDVSSLSEEQQLAMAMQLSMQGAGFNDAMETEASGKVEGASEEEDTEMEDLMQNKEYLQNVLRTLPGVNPEEALHNLEQMSQSVLEQKDEKNSKDKRDEQKEPKK
ncbi:hypothetical protein EMCRGX_G029076 [Ephydatia muelleri]